MRQIFVVIIATLMSISVSARNVNPRHKLTITMNNYVMQTRVGQAVHVELMHMFPKFSYTYGCTSGDMGNESTCSHDKAYKIRTSGIVIHPDFHSSSNEYLSWIMIQAMTKMIYTKKYELKKFSRLRVIEVEQMVFLTAQMYWEELNPPMSRDLDYFDTRLGRIARSLGLSINDFTQSFERDNLLFFFNKVAMRAKRYDGITRTADDIITGNYSKAERDIARKIKEDFNDDLMRLDSY